MSATQQDRQRRGKPTRLERARDITSFVLGWGLIWHQALLVKPADVNETFLFLAAALLGVPFGAEALARIRGGTPTISPGTPSPSPDSSPSSPSSSGSGER